MKRLVLLIVTLMGLGFFVLVGCGGDASPEPAPTPVPTPVVTIGANTIILYHPRAYYLRPGENLRNVAEWMALESGFEYTEIVKAIIMLNPGNVVDGANGLPAFRDTSVLSPVVIPDLPGLPTNLELGLIGPTREVFFHTVQDGDTMYDLAHTYGFGTYEEFAAATGVKDPNSLYVGQVLTWTIDMPARLAP